MLKVLKTHFVRLQVDISVYKYKTLLKAGFYKAGMIDLVRHQNRSFQKVNIKWRWGPFWKLQDARYYLYSLDSTWKPLEYLMAKVNFKIKRYHYDHVNVCQRWWQRWSCQNQLHNYPLTGVKHTGGILEQKTMFSRGTNLQLINHNQKWQFWVVTNTLVQQPMLVVGGDWMNGMIIGWNLMNMTGRLPTWCAMLAHTMNFT